MTDRVLRTSERLLCRLGVTPIAATFRLLGPLRVLRTYRIARKRSVAEHGALRKMDWYLALHEILTSAAHKFTCTSKRDNPNHIRPVHGYSEARDLAVAIKPAYSIFMLRSVQ